MGALGTIGGPLLNLVKGIAIKDARKWADENLGRGLSVPGPLSADINELTIEVYRYAAKIETAKVAMGVPRDNPGKTAKFCTNSFSMNEVGTAREIVQHLQTIRSRLSGLADAAAGRAGSVAADAEKASREAVFNMDYASQQGNQAGEREFALQVHRYTSMKMLAQSNVILIRRRGNDVMAVLDSLIAEMTSKVGYLEANSGAWLQASTECFSWRVHVLGGR